MTSLAARNVSKSYAGLPALREVSLEIECGSIFGLLGPNGSGKTTLIKIFATLLVKDAGSVNILGYDLDSDENKIRRLFGYVGQDTDRSAYARLTVRENLRFFGALRGLTDVRINAQIDKLSDAFGFNENLNKLHMALSGGEKQIVVIMRSFLSDPKLIYLDEPTKGLDPLMAEKVRRFLWHYVRREERSILLTSHILSEVDELASQVALIHNGKIAVTGSSAELKSSLGLRGVLEISAAAVSPAMTNALANLRVTPTGGKPGEGWMQFGVAAQDTSLDAVFQILSQHHAASHYRFRPISLEDAFMHHVARLAVPFEP